MSYNAYFIQSLLTTRSWFLKTHIIDYTQILIKLEKKTPIKPPTLSLKALILKRVSSEMIRIGSPLGCPPPSLSALALCKRNLFLNHPKLGVFKGEQAAPDGCLHLAINYCHKIYTSSVFLLFCFIFPASVMNSGQNHKTKNSITATYRSQFTNKWAYQFLYCMVWKIKPQVLSEKILVYVSLFSSKRQPTTEFADHLPKKLLLFSEKARGDQINIWHFVANDETCLPI